MEDYAKVTRAVRMLKQQGIRVGLPLQRAGEEMILPMQGGTLTIGKVLDLLDKNELHAQEIRRVAQRSPR